MTYALSICQKCGSHTVTVNPVRHHFICAYVGPSYDFVPNGHGEICPKCKRVLTQESTDWEIIGDSSRCQTCGDEGML